MALDDSTKINLSLKKIQGKAQTSNQKEVYNESIGSNVSIGASTVFGKVIPDYVSSSYYSIISGTAERVRFQVSPIEGTKDGSGYYQGFELKLPTDYEASSSNTKAGTEPFTDGKVLNTTNGKLQIIPPSFGNGYTVTAFHTSSGETQITALDARDWVLDYFNGVFFQQDPPSDITENPVFVDGFLYIEDYADVLLASGSSGSITVKDEGSDLTTSLSSLNFVGAGVTATNSGDDVTITITGNTLSRNAITSTTTSSVSNTILGISASADLEVRLPAASGFTDGQSFIIKDEGGNADLHTITILPTGADTIDGRNSLVLESPHSALTLYTDGSSKFFIV